MSYYIERAAYMNIYETLNPYIIPIMWAMAGASLVLLVFALATAKWFFDKEIAKGGEKAFKRVMYYLMDIPYTVFIVLISLFPLMGMLGTVCALLTLDLGGETEALKSNFFQALDTTAWGLIFAIFFKLINSVFQPYIEGRIAKAKKMLEKGDKNE